MASRALAAVRFLPSILSVPHFDGMLAWWEVSRCVKSAQIKPPNEFSQRQAARRWVVSLMNKRGDPAV